MLRKCSWILLILVTLVLIILSTPYYPSEPIFWPGDEYQSRSLNGRHRVLLLTAHPDDECMFFAPTTLALTSSIGNKLESKKVEDDAPFSVYSLCLSSGDADGIGEARKRELEQSLETLHVPHGRRWVLDEPFKDNITMSWDAQLVAEYVRPYVVENEIGTILTFDEHGISSHPNHISLERGVRTLLKDLSSRGFPLRAFSLRTTALLPKYTGPAAALSAKLSLALCQTTLLLLHMPDLVPAQVRTMMPSSLRQSLTSLAVTIIQNSCSSRNGAATFVSGFAQYVQALRAMRAHQTQLVWFRWLYVLFSRYMWVNDWLEIIN